jgi:hypothetical protein
MDLCGKIVGQWFQSFHVLDKSGSCNETAIFGLPIVNEFRIISAIGCPLGRWEEFARNRNLS